MNKLVTDVKRLYKHAALVGAVLAAFCHIVPPQYRVVCDALAQLCSLAKGS